MDKTINNVRFKTIKTNGVKLGAWPIVLGGTRSSDYGIPDTDGGVINAVDIDWNDAVLDLPILGGTKTIKSTSDLLNIIIQLANLINNGGGTTPSTPDKHTVLFHAQGGSTVGSIEVNHGAALSSVINTLPNTSRSGYTFNGWFREDHTGPITTSEIINSDVTFYAGWTEIQQQSYFYFYVGTEKPTSLSQAQTVTSYPAEQTYTNNSGAKAQIYVLTNSNKTVTIHEPNTGAALNIETDTTSISGYNITYTTGKTANTGSVKIKIS